MSGVGVGCLGSGPRAFLCSISGQPLGSAVFKVGVARFWGCWVEASRGRLQDSGILRGSQRVLAEVPSDKVRGKVEGGPEEGALSEKGRRT